MEQNDDPFHQFFMESHKICSEAQFVISSLPNAEITAVEQAIHQLDAIRTILSNLDDEKTTPEQGAQLMEFVDTLLLPLEAFLSDPPPPSNSRIPLHHTGAPGRPTYCIDLNRALLLHDLGNTWKDIASVMGITRSTLYNHMTRAGYSTARKEWSDISDDALDEHVSKISLSHPFIGSRIVLGHLESQGIHLPPKRIQDSLRRVDRLGVLVRWAGIIKRRVYKVRGSNALWHNDGNEKLKPWGFWVHGCVDGHSRLIIYLQCSSNKRSSTVAALFKKAVKEFGWPSRARGDYGTENNDMESLLITYWGIAHRSYLRGRSIHNIRIERLWKDIRKDCLESFRQIFRYLEANGLLDMTNTIHKLCLYLVFQPRIQASLDRSRDAWNHHKLRTERNKTPIAIYELSREHAIHHGYWTGDTGDPIDDIQDATYGLDNDAPLPPADEVADDPTAPRVTPVGKEAEKEAGIFLNDDDDLDDIRGLMDVFNVEEDDGNWGIDVFCRAVVVLTSLI